ncbi:DUF1510 family protein [Aquibacillus halophilus]|uniref:DUF1510 family protein n=1 Tax=Aquibacillus halophilus TaxID=930132 RepID=A0A6A8DCP8_9BACI|nr:YrrS family protein [Aquibacillus halophilus]MRH43040.1 DUF1510 family protein [Aquibacillus halophilus]
MSNDFDNSRVDRFEKRRNNTKAISWLVITGSVLVVVLLGIFIFGGNDNDENQASIADEVENNTENAGEIENTTEENDTTNEAENDDVDIAAPEEESSSETDDESSNQDEETSTQPDQIETETVPSDDENVIQAYTGNWSPIGTIQEEPHFITFEKDSQDWKEMMEAVRLAVGLNEGDMIQWWVSGAGAQSVIATVTNNAQTENYRAYVSWVTNEGWQVTKVEVLKENDKNGSSDNDEEV